MTAFYDTCVFLCSIDGQATHHTHCEDLVDAAQVKWSVALSELSYAEATVSRLIEAFEVACAQHGVIVVRVLALQIQQTKRSRRHDVKKLEKMGLSSGDIKQLFAAFYAGVAYFVTDDSDFWDPSVKSKGRSARSSTCAVYQFARRTFGLQVCDPAEAIGLLRQL